MLDAQNLGGWGSFLLGAAALLTLFGGLKGLHFVVRLIRPRHQMERDRVEALRQAGLSASEATSARSEAVAARNEAASWRSSHDELANRVEDIEKRVVPKLNAALTFIKALVEYIGGLEQAMESAQIRFPITMRMPAVPKELSDDLTGL